MAGLLDRDVVPERVIADLAYQQLFAASTKRH
jgi:hypothetical protein